MTLQVISSGIDSHEAKLCGAAVVFSSLAIVVHHGACAVYAKENPPCASQDKGIPDPSLRQCQDKRVHKNAIQREKLPMGVFGDIALRSNVVVSYDNWFPLQLLTFLLGAGTGMVKWSFWLPYSIDAIPGADVLVVPCWFNFFCSCPAKDGELQWAPFNSIAHLTARGMY